MLEVSQLLASVWVSRLKILSDKVLNLEGLGVPLNVVLVSLLEGETTPAIPRAKVRKECQDDEQEQWQHLEKLCALLLRTALIVASAALPPCVEGVEGGPATAEEGGKQVFRRHEVLLVSLLMLPRDPILITIPIVDLLLFIVGEALGGLRELLERLLRPRRLVLVRVQLQRQLLVRLLDRVLVCVPGYLQDVVVVIGSQNTLDQLHLL
mmetsp:Transcript_34326/g.77571  ORF Transcript_34326/g.77571 Transcript_34326/m.77571 type:complete len:209 (+) Transcript_34326:301-927(+)